MLAIDQLVLKDHLVRKIESAIDFSFIFSMVEYLYSGLDHPSIDPVILYKMVFIQYIFGVRSMRQPIKEIETNVAYRWFLGFKFDKKIVHKETRAYEEKLQLELNLDREEQGKKPFPPEKFEKALQEMYMIVRCYNLSLKKLLKGKKTSCCGRRCSL